MGDARWLEVAPPGAASALVLYPKAMMPDWETRRPSVVFEVEDHLFPARCQRSRVREAAHRDAVGQVRVVRRRGGQRVRAAGVNSYSPSTW